MLFSILLHIFLFLSCSKISPAVEEIVLDLHDYEYIYNATCVFVTVFLIVLIVNQKVWLEFKQTVTYIVPK